MAPFLCVFDLALLRLDHGLSDLKFTVDKQISESVVEEIALRLESAKRILKLIWKDDFNWLLGDTSSYS